MDEKMEHNSSTEENYELSTDTLNILQQFLTEQQKQGDVMPLEDWQLSQFWYSEETIVRLVDEAIAALGASGGNIACVSCPSLVSHFLQTQEVTEGKVTISLFEYDSRFESKHPSLFVHYDYRSPLKIPAEMLNRFDLVIVDPPFIAEECLVKVAQTVRLLSRSLDHTKILLCTGTVIHELAQRLLRVTPTSFKPTHAKNLANEFSAYTNYQPVTL